MKKLWAVSLGLARQLSASWVLFTTAHFLPKLTEWIQNTQSKI